MKATGILHLPEYLRRLRRDVDQLYKHVQEINHAVMAASRDAVSARTAAESVDTKLQSLSKETESLRVRNSELEHMIPGIDETGSKKSSRKLVSDSELFAENHDLDAFYLEFENHFRGSEKEVKQKQQPYIEVLEKAQLNRELPVVDMGCGRGEFLELLTENGFKPIGVDMNEAMVKRARERGFEAVQSDAIGYLRQQRSGSLAGITGFHLAEHIPFSHVLTLMAESHRCLAKGGVLMLETPNPESVFVGAFTFHYDPSHLKPLPPEIMQFSALFKGFGHAEILRLQPELTKQQITHATKNTTLRGALQRLYGPRDYALIAYK